MAVVEIRNDSAVPVALAFAVRPVDLRGRGSAHFAADGPVVRCDGQVTVQLPGTPADTISGRLDPGDVGCVFPLPHTATLRAAVALQPSRSAGIDLDRLPGADAVARGWSNHFGRATRLALPDPTLQAVFEAARRRVVAACPGPVVSFAAIDRAITERDVALVANALADLGHSDESVAVLDSVGWRELPDVVPDSGDVAELVQRAAPTGAIASAEGAGTGDDLAAAAALL